MWTATSARAALGSQSEAYRRIEASSGSRHIPVLPIVSKPDMTHMNDITLNEKAQSPFAAASIGTPRLRCERMSPATLRHRREESKCRQKHLFRRLER